MQVTPDQKELYVREQTALVPLNTEAVKIGRIADFEASSFVWTIMLLDLIKERYGTQNPQLPSTSYTGEMIVEPESLATSESAMVTSGKYQPLVAAPLKREDVTHETTADQWDMEREGHNQWLMERYADKVPESVLSPVGTLQLAASTEAMAAEMQIVELEEASLRGMLCRNKGRMEYGKRVDVPTLETMDPLAFGTADDLKRDRLWVARQNQIKVVQTLALKEFDETRDGVIAWYGAAIVRNLERILRATAEGTMRLPTIRVKGHFSSDVENGERETLVQRIGKSPYHCDPSMSAPGFGHSLQHGVTVNKLGRR